MDIELEAYNEQGELHLKWNENSEFRLQDGQVVIYQEGKGFPPVADRDVRTWKFDDVHENPWSTGLTYGPGYYCARIARHGSKNDNDRKYHRVVELVTQ